MNGSGNVSTVGVDFLDEIPEVNVFIVDLYCGLPFTVKLIPLYSFISAACAGCFCSIRTVLGLSAWSDIFQGIVKTISVAMIVSLVFFRDDSFHNLPMHIDLISFGEPSSTPIIAKSSAMFEGVPVETGDECEIAGVNDGEFSLSQCNPASTVFHSSSFSGRFCLADEPARFLPFNQN